MHRLARRGAPVPRLRSSSLCQRFRSPVAHALPRMKDQPMDKKPILLTGASGALGRMLARELGAAG